MQVRGLSVAGAALSTLHYGMLSRENGSASLMGAMAKRLSLTAFGTFCTHTLVSFLHPLNAHHRTLLHHECRGGFWHFALHSSALCPLLPTALAAPPSHELLPYPVQNHPGHRLGCLWRAGCRRGRSHATFRPFRRKGSQDRPDATGTDDRCD